MFNLVAMSFMLVSHVMELPDAQVLEAVNFQIDRLDQRLIAVDLESFEKNNEVGFNLHLYTHSEALELVATRMLCSKEKQEEPINCQFIGNYPAKIDQFEELVEFNPKVFGFALKAAVEDAVSKLDDGWSKIRLWVFRDLILTQVNEQLNGYAHYHQHGDHVHLDWHVLTRQPRNKVGIIEGDDE